MAKLKNPAAAYREICAIMGAQRDKNDPSQIPDTHRMGTMPTILKRGKPKGNTISKLYKSGNRNTPVKKPAIPAKR